MDEYKAPLVINKLESKPIYDWLEKTDRIGNNELYLIQKDDNPEMISVSYDTENKKFFYTNSDNADIDIVSTAVLKQQMNLNEVATNGSYESLSNKPRINNVILEGNLDTASLNLNYRELNNLPSIPQLTSTYSAADESKAITGKGVSSALSNYASKSTSVTGSGAISGGGELTGNIVLTHKASPTGLSTKAVKVAADSYGHVQIGAPITALDVAAQPITYNVIQSCVGIDAANFSSIVILGTQDESVSFSSIPPFGQKLRIYYANITNDNITVTIDPNDFSTSDYFFFNGHVLTSPYNYLIEHNSNICMDVTIFTYQNGNETLVLTFADVLQDA